MRRSLRIAGKAIGWTLGGALALVVLVIAFVFIGARTERGGRLILETALGFANKYLAAQITVARLHTDLWSGLELEGVEMRDIDGELAARIDRLRVRFSLWPLTHRTLRISSVDIEGGRGRVRCLKDGRVNFAALLRPTTPQPPAPDKPGSPFRVEIHDVHVQTIGRYEPPRDVNLTPFEGAVDLRGAVSIGGGSVDIQVDQLGVSTVVPRNIDVSSTGALRVKDGIVTFAPTTLHMELDGSVAHAFFPAPALRGHYSFDGNVVGPLSSFVVHGQLQTPTQPVVIDGTLRIPDPTNPRFAWNGHVLTRGLDPEPMMYGTPHAAVWLDATGEGDASRGTVAVAHAQVEAGKNRVHARGRFDVAPHEGFKSDLFVDVAAKDLAQLHGHGLPALAGSVVGDARVRYGSHLFGVNAKLSVNALKAPGLTVREGRIDADLVDLAGHARVVGRGVRVGGVDVYFARAELDGDKHGLVLRGVASGDRGTSIDVGLHATPHYGDGPIPVGIATEIQTLELDRRGERWHVDPGAQIAYDGALVVKGLRARSEKQSLALDGRYEPAAGEIDATLHGTGLDLKRIAALVIDASAIPRTELDVVAHARGPIRRPKADLQLTGTLTRTPDQPQDTVHLRVDAHTDAMRFSIKLGAQTHAGTIDVDAAAPIVTSMAALRRSGAPLSLAVDAKIASVRELYDAIGVHPPEGAASLEGAARVSATLKGSGRAPELEVSTSGDGLRYARMHNAKLRAHIVYAHDAFATDLELSLGGDEKHAHGRVRLHAGLPVPWWRLAGEGSWRTRIGEQTPLDARVLLEQVAIVHTPLGLIGLEPPVDGGTVDGDVTIGGRLAQPTVAGKVTAHALRRGELQGVDAELDVDAALRTTKAALAVKIQGSPLLSAHAQLGLDLGTILSGVKPAGASLHADARFEGFELKKLENLLPGIAGTLKGQASADGRLGAPSGKADIEIASLVFAGNRFDTWKTQATYREGVLEGTLAAHEATGGRLDGRARIDATDIDAHASAKGFQLAFVSESESIPLRQLRGKLDLDLDLRGARSSPQLTGSLSLQGAKLAIVADPREITELALRIAIAPGSLRLEQLSGKLGPGHFDATGQAKLAGLVPTLVDAVIHTKELPVVQNPISVAVDSKITVHGEKDGNGIHGTVHIEDGSARLPTLTNVRNLQATGPLKDVVYVDKRGRIAAARAKREATASSLAVDIVTSLPGPFHVRSKEIDVDLKGDLEAKITGPEVRLRGSIQSITGGRMDIFGKRYEIDHVRVGFNGGKKVNPSLDVKITRQLNAAVIGVEVEGTAKRPQLHLSSQPPIYSDSQIIQAILGGDPGDPTTDRGLDKKVTGAVSSLVVGAIKNQLAPQIPIDVIKVDVGDTDYTGIASTRLEVGKYLSNTIYVSYVHQFGSLQIGTRVLSANLGDFEWRFRRNYALDLSVGDAPEGKADVFWTLRF